MSLTDDVLYNLLNNSEDITILSLHKRPYLLIGYPLAETLNATEQRELTRIATTAAAAASGRGRVYIGRDVISADRVFASRKQTSALWGDMKRENTQYGVVFTFDEQRRVLERHATARTFELVVLRTARREACPVRVLYSRDEADVCAALRTVRNRVFDNDDDDSSGNEYELFGVQELGSGASAATELLWESGRLIMVLVEPDRPLYDVDYGAMLAPRPAASIVFHSAERVETVYPLLFGLVSDMTPPTKLELQNEADVTAALTSHAARFSLNECRFVVDRMSMIELVVKYPRCTIRKHHALLSEFVHCTRMAPTRYIVRHALRSDNDRVRGEVVYMIDAHENLFAIADFHRSLVDAPDSGELTSEIVQHLIDQPLDETAIGQFTNGGAAEKLMPLLSLASAQTSLSARESLREVDAAFGTTDAWDVARVQRAFENARANGQHEYVRLLDEWVNRQTASVHVELIGVSFLYDVEQFDADARSCANAADRHRAYKKGDFAPVFRKR